MCVYLSIHVSAPVCVRVDVLIPVRVRTCALAVVVRRRHGRQGRPLHLPPDLPAGARDRAEHRGQALALPAAKIQERASQASVCEPVCVHVFVHVFAHL